MTEHSPDRGKPYLLAGRSRSSSPAGGRSVMTPAMQSFCGKTALPRLRGPLSGIPASAETSQTPISRCHAASAKHAELQCVKIEHNRDSSTTYFFSESDGAPVWQQLEAQLAATDSRETPADATASVPAALSTLTAEQPPTAVAVPEDPWRASRQEPNSRSGSSHARQERQDGARNGASLPPGKPRSGRGLPASHSDRLHASLQQFGRDDVRANLERTWSEHSDDDLPGSSGRGVRRFRKHPRQSVGNYANSVLASMAEAEEETLDLLSKFSELCRAGQLDAALTALSRFVRAERKDVLVRLRQKHFLKEAARHATGKAVRQAMRFVQLLPRTYATLQTYNMLVTVCVQARDMPAALRSVDMLRSVGRKPDAVLYTNLISACAAAGDADAAFRVYAEMLRDGLSVDKHAATTLINACSQEILSTCGSHRRRQLVLLERADGVLREFALKSRGKMDPGIWNAFITTAGRAAQLQRAVRALGEMQAAGMKPSETTYGAVMDACVRNNDKQLALEIYGRAMKAGMAGSLHLHTGAIAACRTDKDMKTALRVFHDMQRSGVQADERLYGVLISVIGSASLSTALDLQESLQESGMAPFKGIHSNLIDACLEHGDLATAKTLFERTLGVRVQPTAHITNSVLNACAKTGQLGEVSRLLCLATRAGFAPDKYTYTAVLTACQYAGAGEVAFSVWRLMQQQALPLDEVTGFVLIRTCFNQLYSTRPGALAKEDNAEPDGLLEPQLLDQLAGCESPLGPNGCDDKLPWGTRAICVYQKLLASGIKPRLHVLERLLACLRLRPLPQKPSPNNTGLGAPIKVREYLMPDGRKASAPQHSVDGVFEKRAFGILEEATAMGVLPCYKAGGGGGVVDLFGMPPTVAEVYVLDILASVTSPEGARRRDATPITLKTPPYKAWTRDSGSREHVREDVAPVGLGDDRTWKATGLAVASLLKRLGIRTVGNPATGDIVLTPNALTRWRQLAERAASSFELAALSSLQKVGHLRTSIHDQQRHIRLGMRDGVRDGGQRPFAESGRKYFRHHVSYEDSG